MATLELNRRIAGARRVAEQARIYRPTVRYAYASGGESVAAWDDTLGRWVKVAFLGIDGDWYHNSHELLIDGKPKATEWIEIEQALGASPA